MVDTVGVEPTSRGGFMPAFHNATYPYKLVERAGFEPAKLHRTHARLILHQPGFQFREFLPRWPA